MRNFVLFKEKGQDCLKRGLRNLYGSFIGIATYHYFRDLKKLSPEGEEYVHTCGEA